jgi:mevalonate kinase
MPAITAKSPGKTILFGEHAVVYGFPAIAVPLNSISLQTTFIGLPGEAPGTIIIRNRETGTDARFADLPQQDTIRAAIQYTTDHLSLKHLPATEISISSTIPIASGLGSSAALASALVRGFSQYLGFNLSDQQVNEIAYEVEKIQHGTPSGIDNSVVTYNRPVYYIKGKAIEFLTLDQPISIVVADTGIPTHTGEVVAQVRANREAQLELIDPLLEQMGAIAEKARQELLAGRLDALGQLMSENHHALQQLGVSCAELDKLVDSALEAGALGAKLCGSGQGGNMVAIAKAEDVNSIRDALLENGAVRALSATVE